MEKRTRRYTKHTVLGDITYEEYYDEYGVLRNTKVIKNTCSYANAPKGWHPGGW